MKMPEEESKSPDCSMRMRIASAGVTAGIFTVRLS